MMPISFQKIILFAVLFTTMSCVTAQKQMDAGYVKSINERAEKIVGTLEIADAAIGNKIKNIITAQYYDIKKIDDETEAAIKKLTLSKSSKAENAKKLQDINAQTEEKRNKLNERYVDNLSKQLSKQQVEKVKDGMTYHVMPNTYKAYQDMLPNLTNDEKKYIYDALYEAREHAMVAGSSDAKHAWFGKYKGRINNYLSANGYDMNKESKAWQQRIKEKEKNK